MKDVGQRPIYMNKIQGREVLMNIWKQNYQELIANIYMQIKGFFYTCEGEHIQKASCHSIL